MAAVSRERPGGTMPRPGDGASTWSARRWLSTLAGFGWGGRLSRGRAYARNGRVLDVEVSPGLVRARVQDTQPRPFRIEMMVEPFADTVWDRVIGALARQAIYTAKLLAGFADVFTGLALLVDAPGRPPQRARGFKLSVPDFLPAQISAIRAFLAIGAVELLWVVTAWSSGAVALLFTAVLVLLFSPRGDASYAAAFTFTIMLPLIQLIAGLSG